MFIINSHSNQREHKYIQHIHKRTQGGNENISVQRNQLHKWKLVREEMIHKKILRYTEKNKMATVNPNNTEHS